MGFRQTSSSSVCGTKYSTYIQEIGAELFIYSYLLILVFLFSNLVTIPYYSPTRTSHPCCRRCCLSIIYIPFLQFLSKVAYINETTWLCPRTFFMTVILKPSVGIGERLFRGRLSRCCANDHGKIPPNLCNEAAHLTVTVTIEFRCILWFFTIAPSTTEHRALLDGEAAGSGHRFR